MANEVKILVRTYNDSKAGMEVVNKEVDKFAKQSSETFSKTFNENLDRTFTTHINEAVTRSTAQTSAAGDKIGTTLGERISTKIRENIITRVYRDSTIGRFFSGGGGGNGHESVTVHDRNTDNVRVNVDVDKQSLMSRLFGAGKDGGDEFVKGFEDNARSGLTGIFSGDLISTLFKGIGFAGLGLALGPPLGAAISAAIMTALGGGAIAVGLVGALKNPRIKTALADVKKELEGTLSGFSANFTGPLENFLASPNKSKTGGKTGLQGVLDQIKPQVDALGKTLGDATNKLLNQGLTGLLQNLLPGVLRAVQGAIPFINILADEMPGIGRAIGKFFDTINNNSAGSQVFFKDLLNALEKIIPIIGAIIGAFSNMYLALREQMAKMRLTAWEFASGFLNAADAAFGWIPGLGPKFAAAKKKVHQFMNDANKDLQNIHDVDVKVKLQIAFGNVWSSIHQITSALQAIGAVGKGKGGGGSGFGGKRAGGISGQAASGGPRDGMTWVGEDGPELVDLSPGSRVWPAGDSRRMAGGGGSLIVRPMIDRSALAGAHADLVAAVLKVLRIEIRDGYGGSAQMALGVN